MKPDEINKRRPMIRSMLLALAVGLAACAAEIPDPSSSSIESGAAPSASPSGPPSVSEGPGPDSPLAEALQFVTANIVTVEFVDWAGIKEQKGFGDLTGAATQVERDAFREAMLAPAVAGQPRRETEYLSALTYHPSFTTLVDEWGFDALDLEWEASLSGIGEPLVFVHVLKLRDTFDFATLQTRFEQRGYAHDTRGQATIWTHGISQDPWLIILGQLPMANVAVLESDHVLVIGSLDLQRGRDGLAAVLDAHAGPGVAASVRASLDAAARGLDHPINAYLAVGSYLCTRLDPANNPQAPPAAVAEIAAAAPLHLYAAFGLGYSRAHEPIGRFVFAYDSAADAEADLAGRESLATTGTLLGRQSGRTAAEFFTVDSTRVDGSVMSLEVTPRENLPQLLFHLVIDYALTFAACAT